MQFTITRSSGTSETFESAFATNAQRSSRFACDLLHRHVRGLTDGQWAWVHKLATEAQQQATAEQQPGVAADFAAIVRLMNHAAQHLQHPRITLAVGTVTVRLSLAGRQSRNPGSINVTDDKPFGSNKYFGRIDTTGRFIPGRDLTDEVRETIRQLAADPARFAGEYGRLHGVCCFCRLRLRDERSTAVGYGEICAGNWGLPWGVRATDLQAEVAAAVVAVSEPVPAVYDESLDPEAAEWID